VLSLPPAAAVAFDCDGLLVDTETCWSIAEGQVFARHGMELTPALKAVLIGTTIEYTVAHMVELFERPGTEAMLLAEITDTVAEIIAEQAVAMPGAVELVHAVAGRVPVAVVSNSERRLVELALSKAGLSQQLPLIVAAEDVSHGKPAPDPYLRACELLEVRPSQAVAFEDSLVGVNAAKSAGLTVVGVPTVAQAGFTPHVRLATLDDPLLRAWAQGL
jgi:HAD superfamily hydrolase (TIGR01509 family)